nr:MAG TPA: hypothetical protein [Caudoviricetes sp.]
MVLSLVPARGVGADVRGNSLVVVTGRADQQAEEWRWRVMLLFLS